MTDLATLQAQVNYLMTRCDNLASRGSTDIPGTPRQVTGTSFTNMSAAFPVAGGEPSDATVYRLVAWGDLTVPAASAQIARWCVAAYSLNGDTGTPLAWTGVGGAPLAQYLNTGFTWTLLVTVGILTSGASGAMRTALAGNLAQYQSNLGNVVGGVANSFPLAGADISDISVDTTASTTVALQAKWGGSSSGQRIRCFGSTFERIG